MAKKRKGGKKRGRKMPESVKRDLAARKKRGRKSRRRSPPKPTRRKAVAKKRKSSKRHSRSAGAGKKRRGSRRGSRRDASRGSASIPFVAALGGAAVTVGGLYALKKWIESKQKTDPKYALPEVVSMGAPAAGALALLAADRLAKITKVRPYVGPALAAAAAFILANWLNKPKGAGARRLRGSGASAAREALQRRGQMRALPGGAGASAARAALA